MIVDANLLLYAAEESSPHHERAKAWLTAALTGTRRVGIPMASIAAVMRLATHPRIVARPRTPHQVAALITSWLDAAPVWVPPTGENTARILNELVTTYHVTGNLVPDAMLAAMALEHGLAVYSADTDFARFEEVRWVNPLR